MRGKQDRNDKRETDADYQALLELESLESLLEELEEEGIQDLNPGKLPAHLAARMEVANVASLADLRAKIAQLHLTLDSEGNL